MTEKQGRLAPMCCASACRGAADCVIALKSTQGLLGFFLLTLTDVVIPRYFLIFFWLVVLSLKKKKKSLG